MRAGALRRRRASCCARADEQAAALLVSRSAYINVFRGVPALVSVIWVYFGWSLLLGINFTVFQAAVIALVALYGAFIAEIYRSALEAIPRGPARGRARARA